jgi:hypothetical protein
LDDLLSRGSLGGPTYDRILQATLKSTVAADPGRGHWWKMKSVLVPGLLAASSLGIWLSFVRPSGEHLTAKGSIGTASATVDVGCAPSSTRVCRVGGTLMFTVNAALTSGYLAAYAEPIGTPGHARLWYFPTATGEAPQVGSGSGTIVVPEGITIGPEHRPGRYRVTVVVSQRPLARSEMDAPDPAVVRSRSTVDFEVVP